MLEGLDLSLELNTLTLIGLIITLAFLGSKLFQRMGIPQVVGFIVMGVAIGHSGLNIVSLERTEELLFISQLALGLIGFDMGGHLHVQELRRLGKSILFILIFEALGAFVVVAIGTYLLCHSLYTALLFGAISSATAPAATVDVLAEYDAAGPLTTTLIAVVGLDDALSLLLYSITAAFAESTLAHTGPPPLLSLLELPLLEIGGSLLLGAGLGLVLGFIMSHLRNRHDVMAVAIGTVILGVGLSVTLGFSLILTTMVLGSVVVNRDARNGHCIRYVVEQAGPVIYVLFFALVGARFRVDMLPRMGVLGIAYVLLRSGGKFAGAWLGGRLGGAVAAVRNNLGLGLLSQAGVAIGLALDAAARFGRHSPQGNQLGNLIINVITATTFIVQIIGPIAVKQAITRAGEVGGAIATEDEWISEGIT